MWSLNNRDLEYEKEEIYDMLGDSCRIIGKLRQMDFLVIHVSGVVELEQEVEAVQNLETLGRRTDSSRYGEKDWNM